MYKELVIFFSAWTFYTRFPAPSGLKYSPEILSKSIRYFPLIGYFVAITGALLFFLSTFIFPLSISVLISISATIIATGALHEDGFADVCDGIGGGWTKEQILKIMKDPRLGTFGVVGLVLVLSFKFLLLYELLKNFYTGEFSAEQVYFIIAIFVAGHALSRTAATLLLFTLPYVRATEESKVPSIFTMLERKNLIVACLIGITPLLTVPPLIGAILPVAATSLFLNTFFKRWIGGITGDCLGATQQITEVIFYAFCIASIKYWQW